MSVKVMGRVWDLQLPHSQKLVLLAMADHADHDGGNCYPGVPLIVHKTGYSDRQVRRIIAELEAAGLLVIVQQASQHTPIVYRIDLTAGTLSPPYKGCQNVTPDEGRPDKMSPLRPDKMSPQTKPGVTSLYHKGIGVQAGPARAKGRSSSQYNRHDHDSIESISPPLPDDLMAFPIENQSQCIQPEGRGQPREGEGDERLVDYLLTHYGMQSVKIAQKIAALRLDGQTLLGSIDNMLADGVPMGRIINNLLTRPPKPGQPYQKQRTAHGPMRNARQPLAIIETDEQGPL